MRQMESPLVMYLAYDQWKEEHEDLHGRLLELCRYMRWNPANYEFHDWESHHRAVRESFIPFMQDWQKHLERERKMIFPVTASSICGGRIGPIAVLEQDERIASQYYETYVNAVEGGASSEEALSRLLQVLVIAAEHFRIEDETVVPAAEQLMGEIEYCGS